MRLRSSQIQSHNIYHKSETVHGKKIKFESFMLKTFTNHSQSEYYMHQYLTDVN